MGGRHKIGCKKGKASCGDGCWCHGTAKVIERTARGKSKAAADLKGEVVNLRTALDAAKAYVADATREIKATTEELWGMIGGNE